MCALVGLDILELTRLVTDGIELGTGSASHCGATRDHGFSCFGLWNSRA
jgi:hypothetical protein